MKIATWNVNGIRAREAQLLEWLAREQPDVVCLQEIKASLDQLPFELLRHRRLLELLARRARATRASALLRVASARWPTRPAFTHPAFDFEQRIACATSTSADLVTVPSIYVPNGGKDFDAKMRFLDALGRYVAADARTGRRLLVLCGDLNVARTDATCTRRSASRTRSAQRPDERALIERSDLARPGRRRAHARPRQRRPVHLVGAVAQHAAAQHRLAHRLRAGLRVAGRGRAGVRRAARGRHERSRARRGHVRVAECEPGSVEGARYGCAGLARPA